ncbi:MAG: DMT family transporter [Pseudomonadota bacterium]
MRPFIRLFLLTALTMTAFAANSILNRLALLDDAIGPSAFATIRVATGAAVLAAILVLRSRSLPHIQRPHWAGVAALTAYMIGFSYAYVSMDAGIGALILFGGVQVTMFGGAILEGQRPTLQRWGGMALAMVGLAILTLPTGAFEISLRAVALMGLAAFGWGVYSLLGRGATDPIAATGWNFIYCLPIIVLALLVFPDEATVTATGVLIAMIAGGVTSALGYALWYSLLPKLGATNGALAQLSAPALALGMGALFLGETITLTAILATVMILGGIAIGLMPPLRSKAK